MLFSTSITDAPRQIQQLREFRLNNAEALKDPCRCPCLCLNSYPKEGIIYKQTNLFLNKKIYFVDRVRYL